jgi:hypothetical protein
MVVVSFFSYGPVKPHLGHLYGRPNLRHFPQRFIWISPQLGQRNLVASAPGAIGLPQLVHVVSMSVCGFSVILGFISHLWSGSVMGKACL